VPPGFIAGATRKKAAPPNSSTATARDANTKQTAPAAANITAMMVMQHLHGHP